MGVRAKALLARPSRLARFEQWAAWGRELMDLHIGYEAAEPWPVKRTETPDVKARAAGQAPLCVLKSEPEAGRILVDGETTLARVARVSMETVRIVEALKAGPR